MKRAYRGLLSMVLATFLVANTGGAALAITRTVNPEVIPDESGISSPDDSSQTAVGVRVVKADVSVLSYEIPLLVSCVATQSVDSINMIFPSEYYIRNRSFNADGTLAPIGVTGVKIELAEGISSTWSILGEEEELTKPGDIKIKFGNRALPTMALDNGKVAYINLNVQDYLFGNNDSDSSTYNPILSELNIPLSGEIFLGTQLNDKSATSIFKVSYILSFLDPETNCVIGTTYEEGPVA